MARSALRFAVMLMLGLAGATAQAQDRNAFVQRAAAASVELFRSLDRDGDGAVTRLEAQGDVNFIPVFNDIDINRDGIATKAELDRYLSLEYGVRPAS